MRRRIDTPGPARQTSTSRVVALWLTAILTGALPAAADAQTRNVILFVGDGMGVSTVSFTRFAAVGVDGRLVMDQFPYTALSRTSSADHITPDSAGTMTAMTTGVNTNSGIIGYPPTTERGDFNGDGDGMPLTNIAELAKARGYSVGIVTTARLTHATPAAVYAHVHDRNLENDIAAQLTPFGAGYNRRLGTGIDVLFGGGRRFFLPSSMTDEEGSAGRRTDGRDLRAEFEHLGYTYAWNQAGFDALGESHRGPRDRALRVEPPGVRVRPAHRHGRRAEPDRADPEGRPDPRSTRAAVLPDGRVGAHRPRPPRRQRLPQSVRHGRARRGHRRRDVGGGPARDDDPGHRRPQPRLHPRRLPHAADGRSAVRAHLGPERVPGAAVQRHLRHRLRHPGRRDRRGRRQQRRPLHHPRLRQRAPGHRMGPRVDPNMDATPGYGDEVPADTAHPAYRQEATVPLRSETHSAEDVAIYAIGAGSEVVRGTVPNTQIFHWTVDALGLDGVNLR